MLTSFYTWIRIDFNITKHRYSTKHQKHLKTMLFIIAADYSIIHNFVQLWIKQDDALFIFEAFLNLNFVTVKFKKHTTNVKILPPRNGHLYHGR